MLELCSATSRQRALAPPELAEPVILMDQEAQEPGWASLDAVVSAAVMEPVCEGWPRRTAVEGAGDVLPPSLLAASGGHPSLAL